MIQSLLYLLILLNISMCYSSEFLIGFQNKNNPLCETIKDTVLDLGIHKRPVNFTHRGKRKQFKFGQKSSDEHDLDTNLKIKLVSTIRKKSRTTNQKVNFSNLTKVKLEHENNFMFPKICFFFQMLGQ